MKCRLSQGILRNLNYGAFGANIFVKRITCSASSTRIFLSDGNAMLRRINSSIFRMTLIIGHSNRASFKDTRRISAYLMTFGSFGSFARRAVDRRRTTKISLCTNSVIFNYCDLSFAVLRFIISNNAKDNEIRNIRRTGKSSNGLNQLSTHKIRGLNAGMNRFDNFLGVGLARKFNVIRGTQIIIIRTIGIYPGLSFLTFRYNASRANDMIKASAWGVISLAMNIATSGSLNSVSLVTKVNFRRFTCLLLSMIRIQFNVLINARRIRY